MSPKHSQSQSGELPRSRLNEQLNISTLTFDCAAHAPELAGMGIALRLGIQIIALFDKGLRSHTGATFGGERLGHPFFERLPGHAQGQHGQRMAQVDYVIDTRAEKSSQSGQGQHHGKTPRKLFLLEIKQGKQPPVAPPQSQCS